MAWIITKYFLTAALVVLVSELAKRSDKLGGLVAALPLVTVLALIWLYVESSLRKRSQTTPGIRSGMSCRHCRCSLPFRHCFRALVSGQPCWPASSARSLAFGSSHSQIAASA